MADSQTTYSHSFILESDPEAIDFSTAPANFYNKANLHDSIIDFFPYGECQFDDSIGIISEGVLYNESMKFKIKLSQNQNKDELPPGIEPNELSGDFLWSSYDIPVVPFNGGKVTGTSVFGYISYYRFLDQIGSSSYKDTPHNVAKEIASEVFEIPSKNQKISTGGILDDYWYRSNELFASFLRTNLALYSFNQASKSPDTPFFTFINLQNEFYFMSLADLFDQKSVATLKPFQSAEQGFDNTAILSYTPIYTGYNANADSYSVKQYRFTNEFETEELFLKDAILKPQSKGNFLFEKQKLSEDPYSFQYFGLVSETDENNYKGFVNTNFTDNMLSYRLNISTKFNSNLVAGHVIDVEMNSVLSSDLSPEYSGKYLILDSHHGMGNDGQGYTNCLIAKPVVELRSDHKFKSRYL